MHPASPSVGAQCGPRSLTCESPHRYYAQATVLSWGLSQRDCDLLTFSQAFEGHAMLQVLGHGPLTL